MNEIKIIFDQKYLNITSIIFLIGQDGMLKRVEELFYQGKHVAALEILEKNKREINKSSKQFFKIEFLRCKILKRQPGANRDTYNKALKILENILANRNNIASLGFIFEIKLEKIETLRSIDKTVEAFDLLDKVEQQLKRNEHINSNTIKSKFMYEKAEKERYNGAFDRAEEFYLQALRLFPSNQPLYEKRWIYNGITNNLVSQNRFDEATIYISKIFNILKSYDNTVELAKVYNAYGNFYTGTDNLDEALKMKLKSLELKQCHGSQQDIAYQYLQVSRVYHSQGNIEKAVQTAFHADEIFKKIKHKRGIIVTHLNVGDIYKTKGELWDAHANYSIALKLLNELDQPVYRNEALAKRKIGEVYRLLGQFRKAEEMFYEVLEIEKKIDMQKRHVIDSTKQKLALIYYELGNFTKSERLLKEVLNTREQTMRKKAIAETLFYQILVYHDRNISEIQRKNRQLQDIVGDSDFNRYRIMGQLANAIELKSKRRLKDKLQAIDLLGEIIEADEKDIEMSKLASVFLCDLLLLELKATSDPIVFEELKKITKQWFDFAKEQLDYASMVDSIIISSKISLLESDLQQALDHLDLAKNITSSWELIHLNLKVENEINLIEKQLKIWDDMIRQNPSLKQKMQRTKIQDYISKVTKSGEQTII